jgi:hypothetical protein
MNCQGRFVEDDSDGFCPGWVESGVSEVDQSTGCRAGSGEVNLAAFGGDVDPVLRAASERIGPLEGVQFFVAKW